MVPGKHNPPGFLRGPGLEKWNSIIASGKRIFNYDLLAAYCSAYSRWIEAEEWLRGDPDVDRTVVTVWDDKGNIKKHGVSPQVKVSSDAVKEMARLAKELGL